MNDATYILRILVTAREEVAKKFSEMSRSVRDEAGKLGKSFRDLGDDTDRNNRPLARLHSALRALLPDFRDAGEGARDFRSQLSQLTGQMEGLGMALAIKWAQPLLTSFIALAAEAVSLASSLGLAAAALGGLATAALAQAIPAIGLLVFAFKGLTSVMQVVKLREQEREQAATGQADAAKKVASAEDALANSRYSQAQAVKELKDAEQALVRAREQAHRRIQDQLFAEQQATLSRKDAELALLDAKKKLRDFDQQRQQEDLSGLLEQARERLKRAQQEGDINEIISARANLAGIETRIGDQQETQDPNARRRARLDVDQAELNLRRARVQEQRAREDANRARRQGVAGSDEVRAAQERVARAQHNLIQSNKDLTKSLQGVNEAQKGTSATASKLAYEWNKLSPVQKQLVLQIEALQKMVRSGPLGQARDTVMGAFVNVLKDLQNLLKDPTVQKALQQLAQALADAITQFSHFVTTGEGRKALVFFMEEGAKNLPILVRGMEGLVGALGKVAQAFSPLLTRALEGWADLMDRFSHWTMSPQFERFVKLAGQHLTAWVQLAGAFFRLFAALGGASAGQGLITVTKITAQLNKWADWINRHPQRMQKFFSDSRKIVEQLWRVVVAVGIALAKTFDPSTVKALVDFLTEVLIPAFSNVIGFLGTIFKLIHEAMALPGFKIFAQLAFTVLLLAFAFERLLPALQIFKTLLTALFIEFSEVAWILLIIAALIMLEQKFHFIEKSLAWLTDRWNEDWGGMRTKLTELWDWIRTSFYPGLRRVFESLAEIVQQMWRVMKPIWEVFKAYIEHILWPALKLFFDLWKMSVGTLYEVVKNNINAMVGILHNFAKIFKGVIDFVSGLIHGDWGKAWKGLKEIFSGVWSDMLIILQTFLNNFIAAWNWLIGALSHLGIPDDWKIERRFHFADTGGPKRDAKAPAGARGPAREEGAIHSPMKAGKEHGIYQPVPGGIFRFAEAGHPEAIIPLDPRKRKRANAILSEVMKITAMPSRQSGAIHAGSRIVRGAAHGIRGVAEEVLGHPVQWFWDHFVGRLGLGKLPELLRKSVGALLDRLRGKVFSATKGGAQALKDKAEDLGIDLIPGLRQTKSHLPHILGLAEGAIVPDGGGARIPSILHVGEWVLNMRQQQILARELGISLRELRSKIFSTAWRGRKAFIDTIELLKPGVQNLLSFGPGTAAHMYTGFRGMTPDEFQTYLFSAQMWKNPKAPYSFARTDHGRGNFSWGVYQEGGIVNPKGPNAMQAGGQGGRSINLGGITVNTTQAETDVDYIMRRAQLHLAGGY